ncbi:Molybdate-anion transporter (Major facilitator superfamily domain-containing protein 5) (Molybdate transporter 2 homolog) (hsMOT2) [Durusdinium trenchii]|uniref:Molybdate-anion transporter (Major facilitator superfamily domain-containing protein 5) (Molybdate transporter 2 homolog) (HsMOT2) n=1 Tax=Durusdinium trenchii TaxID=1381693 RepID=A0ABP0H7E6_9DINO
MSAVLCAVLAAQVTEAAGYVAPFDAAIVFLSLSAACIFKLWGENFGDSTVAPGANFAVGWVVMVCVGVYFPAIGFLRAKFIPEEVRATVVNFFRIPLNALVVMILLNIAHMSSEAVSLWSAFILVGAAAAQEMLTRIAGSSSENVRKVQQEEL